MKTQGQLPYKHSWQDTGKIQVIKRIQGNVRDKAGQQNRDKNGTTHFMATTLVSS